MFPLSVVHYMELAENPRDHQRQRAADAMMKLSREPVTIAPLSKIIDEELSQELHRRLRRPMFPIKVKKFGVGAGFAALGEPRQLRLIGGTAEDRLQLAARMGTTVKDLEREANTRAEYMFLAGPSAGERVQIPGYDPYAARGIADRELDSFNVMVNTLRTMPEYGSRPLDLICARQLSFDIIDNYTRALISAGYTKSSPWHSKEDLTDFLMSLPSRRVASLIQFHYLQDIHRNWSINDLRDITALSMAIPYCDIVVTDKKAWDTATNRARLDREFSTAIFSRLNDLSDHLQYRAKS